MSGAVDLLLRCASKSDSPNIDFSFEKARDVEPFNFAAVAHFEPDMFWLTPSAKAARMRPISKSQRYVVRYLQEHGDSTLNDITSQADVCSENAARQAVYALVDLGYVRRTDAGGAGERATYGLTENGRGI
jgi:predicted HTH transcriptional regulator